MKGSEYEFIRIKKMVSFFRIYLLNPNELNLISSRKEIYRLPDSESEFCYTDIYWKKKASNIKAPIAIEPILINDRMFAQRGVFTVYNDSIEPIEDKYPGAVKKVKLSHEIIPAAIEFLELANINHLSVYPDFAGIAGHLSRTSGLKSRW